MWAPDVYQGSPSSVTAFMTVGAKAAGFAALLRVFVVAFQSISADMTPILWALAALTMFGGNILAIAQSNIKRMLAYASIAQSGYMLMAFVPYGQGAVLKDTIAAMLFFLVTYSLATLGAWAVVIALEKEENKDLEIADYAGLGRKYPWLGAAMTVFMLSFTGMPLTLGFWGKFYLFSTAVEGGFTGLALVGLLTSLISAYYYLRVVVYMFMKPGEPTLTQDPWIQLTALVSAFLVVALSLFPGPLLDYASAALMLLR
jgi:NADH-quinone oxidoreductase subunit N